MPIFVSILLISSMNGTLFSASRFLYSAGRERQFPSFNACINHENDSPRGALLFHVLLATAFSFVGNVEELISMVGFSSWAQRMVTMLALLYIRWSDMPVHPGAIRVPTALPVIFFTVCLSLVSVTVAQSFSSAAISLLMLGTSLFLYALFLWEKTLSRFRVYCACSHWLNRENDLAELNSEL